MDVQKFPLVLAEEMMLRYTKDMLKGLATVYYSTPLWVAIKDKGATPGYPIMRFTVSLTDHDVSCELQLENRNRAVVVMRSTWNSDDVPDFRQKAYEFTNLACDAVKSMHEEIPRHLMTRFLADQWK